MPRLGISVLSKDNVSVAYNEEVMCNKRTGEFLIKTTDGDSMSYQYFSRLRSHEYKAEKIAREYGLVTRTGHNVDIYSISVDSVTDGVTTEIVLPDTVVTDTNYANTAAIINGAVERFIVSVDMDPIIVESGEVAKDLYDGISVTINMKAYATVGGAISNTENITTTYSLSKLPTCVNSFSASAVANMSYAVLDNITFSRNGSQLDTIRTVLHSVMLIVETVNTI